MLNLFRSTTLAVIILLIVSSIAMQSCDAGKKKSTDERHAASGWLMLFDGSSTNAWRGFGQDFLPPGWTISDSLLYTSGQGGDLGGDIISREMFEDFELMLEWRISDGGNSGIFFHVVEGDYPAAYATGPEYQIIDDIGFAYPLEDWQQCGANYAMHPADTTRKIVHPAGEWNHSAILVKDGKVVHRLNGEKIVEYELWTEEWKALVEASKWKDYPDYGLALYGHIGLQDHGSPMAFRNIRIRDLTEKGNPVFNGKDLDGWKIHGTEQWYVDKGELVCESGEDKQYGYLSTEKTYRDFVLRLKFLQEADGNSGVFFRSSVEGTTVSGWQVEVAPPGNNTGGIYESYGRGWLWEIPEDKEHILKAGQWNDLVVRVEGDRVMTWLNGQLMTDLRDEKIGKATGSVALQIHDGGGIKVRWKDIYIREINKETNEIQ